MARENSQKTHPTVENYIYGKPSLLTQINVEIVHLNCMYMILCFICHSVDSEDRFEPNIFLKLQDGEFY